MTRPIVVALVLATVVNGLIIRSSSSTFPRVSSVSTRACVAPRARARVTARLLMGIASAGGPVGITSGDGAEVSAIASQAAPSRRMDEYGDEAAAPVAPQQSAAGRTELRGSSLVDPMERAHMAQQRAASSGPSRGSMLFSGAVLAAFVSGLFFAFKAYYARQESLVRLFGSEMSDYAGDDTALKACAKQYKRALGPNQFREEMFSEFLLQLGKKKPVTTSVMKTVELVANLFRYKEVKLAKVLVKAGATIPRKQPGLRSKLLFYGKRLCTSQKAQEALQPLEQQMAANYRSNSAAIVGAMLRSMADQALRDSITAADAKQLPEGWELLGLPREEADGILAEMSDEGAVAAAGSGNDASWKEFYAEPVDRPKMDDEDSEAVSLYQQLIERKIEDGDGGGGAEAGGAKSYECQECGYTLFVAKGREWKFFGDDFKCPECGAPKDKFTEREAGGVSS